MANGNSIIGGTRGAVVYGNEPYDNLGRNLAVARQESLRQQQQAEIEARRLAQAYRDNALTVSGGRLWAPEIASLAQSHLQRGIGYRQQGRNVYDPTDPDYAQYMTERSRIQSMDDYRKAIETDFKKVQDLIQSNPNKYDPESINAINSALNNMTLEEAYQSGWTLPQLRERFDLSEALRGLNAVVREDETTEGNVRRTVTDIDRPQTARAVLGRVANTPGGQEYINRITNGIPINEIALIPDTLQDNIAEIREEYEGSPALRQQMAIDLGITSSDSEEFKEAARLIAEERLNAKRNFSQFMDQAMGAVGVTRALGVKERPDFTLEDQQIQRENLALAKSREARLRSQASESTTKDITFAGSDSVPVGTPSRNNVGRVPIQNGVNFYNTTVSMTGGDAFNMNTREPFRDTPSINGQLVKLAEYPFDSATGELLDETQVANNPNVEYRKMAQIRQSDGGLTTDLLVPANKVPSTLPKEKQKMVNEFLKSEAPSTSQQPETQFKGVPKGGF